MLKDEVLNALQKADRAGAGKKSVSGAELCRTLGVSRAAVWKAVESLRKEGYEIEAQSAVGYRLIAAPDRMNAADLRAEEGMVGREVACLEEVDSTNDEIKRRALAGAQAGLVVTAEAQTAGKGRRGRGFQSLSGKGLYLSVLLKPDVPLEQISQLTAWTAVAVCRAVEAVCDVRPQIKWPNDVLVDGKKLCGILTEMGVEGETGALNYVVVGMGTNVSQTAEDFGPELSEIATSLHILGANVTRRGLARALIAQLDHMNAAFPAGWEEYLEEYRSRCVTLGREVRLIRNDWEYRGKAEALTEDFRLVVCRQDGMLETVSSGEVSVRGLLGYQ